MPILTGYRANLDNNILANPPVNLQKCKDGLIAVDGKFLSHIRPDQH